MENQLRLSGIFLQVLRHWRSSIRSSKTSKVETLNLKILTIESFSRQSLKRQWTYLGPGEDKQWYGTLSSHPEKLDSTVTQMVTRFNETGSISALTRGILTRKNNRDTIHFNVDVSNSELLFRTIRSANQLSIHGAVSS